MSVRALLAVILLITLGGCGGDQQREVRLLAPVGIVEDGGADRFERATGCRVELRVYDEDEDVAAIARRRDADAIAGPTPPGGEVHVSQELARLTLDGGVVVTIPRELSSAFRAERVQPAGRRAISWSIREDGDNPDCARRWIAYAISQ